MLSGLFDRLQRILLFADKAADEIVCEETDILEKVIPHMFEVMQGVAKFACDYVKCGRFGRKSSFLDLSSADDRSENIRWIGILRDDRRNGQKVAQSHRRFRPCNECRDSPPRQRDW